MSNVWQSLKNNSLPIFVVIGAVLLRYYELFLGAKLFWYGDQYINSGWIYGNSIGNGWRPEKGFGISFFYADPGAWHSWSLFSLWAKVFQSRIYAYQSSIVIMDILAAIAMYFFLRKIIPSFGKWVCILAPLIVFSVSQDSMHFNLVPISVLIGVPILLILLHDFYKQAKILHLFAVVILFWFVMFTGSYLTFASLPGIGLTFTILYCIYFKESWRKILTRYLLLMVVGGVGTIILGFWEFYSIFLESHLIEFAREKVFHYSFKIIPDIKSVGAYILNFFQFYSIPTNISFLGIGWRPFYYSWNICAIIPLIIIFFMFRRSTSFWEFSLKWLLIVFYISQVILLFPILHSVYSIINIKCNLLFNYYGFSWAVYIFPLQLGLIAIFLRKVVDNDYITENSWGKRVQVWLAYMLVLYYAGLTVFCFLSLVMPEVLLSLLPSVLEKYGPMQKGIYSKNYLVYFAWLNIKAFQDSMHWYSFVFYSVTTFLVFLFIRRDWLYFIIKKKTIVLFSILMFLGIFYSWTVYPLNYREHAWEEIAPDLPIFKPTDRFYYVTSSTSRPGDTNNLDRYKQEVIDAGGANKYLQIRGEYFESPGLRLHGVKAFTQKNVTEFICRAFNADGTGRLKDIRSLSSGGPLISSELLDMGAVNYYYFKGEPLSVPEHLSLCAKTKLVSIYKNLNAWPYYYLAENLQIMEEGEHLNNVQRGTAYLSENDFFKLPENAGNSSVQLKEFSYGRMVFDFQGDKEGLLLVADAWHPFWKATSGDKDLSVVKANEIFKGVKLPSGDYTFTLFFDTSPYFPGIYVSILAWILFLTALFLVLKYRLDIAYFSKTRVYRNLQRLISE